MDSHETWGGEEENVGAAPPLKNHENKIFAIYSSLWGAFSPCEGLFRYLGAFLLLFSGSARVNYGRPFSRCGGLFAIFFSL